MIFYYWSEGVNEKDQEVHTHFIYQVPVLHQEGPITPSPRNLLGTTEVNVDRVTMRFEDLGCCQELCGRVGAKLDKEGTIAFGR